LKGGEEIKVHKGERREELSDGYIDEIKIIDRNGIMRCTCESMYLGNFISHDMTRDPLL
jgi:hypothetical protein